MTSSDWLPTACILCECNCGIVVQVDDRRLADKAHPGSAGHLQQGVGWTITRTTGLA